MKCLSPFKRLTIAAICLAGTLAAHASAQQFDTSKEAPLGVGDSSANPPLLIIKKDSAVATITKDWAVGIQNEAAQIKIVGANGGSNSGTANVSSISIQQNPTGANVQSNGSALTQPPTMMISLPTCTGGQVLNSATGQCATPCAAPSTTTTTEACSTYYSSAAWAGTELTTTSWSCSSPFASPVSSVSNNTSGCAALTPCVAPSPTSSTSACGVGYSGPGITMTTTYTCQGAYGAPISSTATTGSCVAETPCVPPASTTSSQACSAYYNSAAWTGTEKTTTSYSCSSQYGSPTATTTADTSGCVSQAACTPPASTTSTESCNTYFGSNSYIGNVTLTQGYSCPSPYGSPTANPVSYNTSACVSKTPCIPAATTTSAESCKTYFGSPGYSGSVTVTQSYSCTGTYGTSVANAPSYNTSGCQALTACSAPVSSVSTESCSTYYGSAGYSGNVTVTQSYSCPSTYGTPIVDAPSYNTSGCTALQACTVPASKTSTETCNAYYGSTGYAGNVTVTQTYYCPSQYGAASANAPTYNTSGCSAAVPTCTLPQVLQNGKCVLPGSCLGYPSFKDNYTAQGAYNGTIVTWINPTTSYAAGTSVTHTPVTGNAEAACAAQTYTCTAGNWVWSQPACAGGNGN